MTLTTPIAELTVPAPWRRISTGDTIIGIAERAALGTSARLAVWPPENLYGALAAVDNVLSTLDRQASRFRPDSEISWIHRSRGGLFMLSDGLAEAISVALAAAEWTGGLTDPTIGDALISLGYDRDFAAIDPDQREPPGVCLVDLGRRERPPGGMDRKAEEEPIAELLATTTTPRGALRRTRSRLKICETRPRPPTPAPGWQAVRLDGPLLRLPAGILLDLGATAKGLGSDRAVRAALAAGEDSGGVLVSLGGDIAIGGTAPRDGWPILVADGPDPAGSSRAQVVRLLRGAVATSSITCRQWRRAGRLLHHIVDPRTGLPADGPWQTVSVAAATCADANAAATAAIVAGEQAAGWLASAGLPARLVAHDGEVRCVGGWPAGDGERIEVPSGSHVYSGARPGGSR